MGKNTTHTVIDFQDLRKERLEERRRQYERVMFRNALGVYTVIEQEGLHAIELIDVSEGGISFQVADSSTLELKNGTVIPLRFYFASDSFIPADAKVVNCVNAIDNGQKVRRYGCMLDKTMASYSAIYHLVQFITKCAEHGRKDDSHLKIFY